MKVLNYLVIISVLLILFACSSNKPVTPPVPQEVVKTPVELANEAAIEGADAYQSQDFDLALTKFNEALDQYNLALPTAVPADSIPTNIFRLKMNIAQTHSDKAFAMNAKSDFTSAAGEYVTSLEMFTSLKPQATPKDGIQPKIDNLYLNIALCYQSAKDYQKAIEYFDKYLETNPNEEDVAKVVNLKYHIYSENLLNEKLAIENLTAFATKTNNFNAEESLGDVYAKANDLPNAILWYEKARTAKSTDEAKLNVVKKLANVYRNTNPKQLVKSNDMLELLVASNSTPAEKKAYYKTLGANYKDLNKGPKAAEYFDKAIQVEYDEQAAFFLCGYYYELKNYNKMLAYSNMIMNNNPTGANLVNALLYRGMAKYYLNDKKGAKADFERIQNDPKQGATAKQFLKTIK